MGDFYPPSLSDDNSPNQVSYHGNCHCGAVRYKLTVESLHDRYITRCNCILCHKHGMLFTHCKRKCLTFTRGWDNMSAYKNGTGMRPMRFCTTCACPMAFDVRDPEAEGEGEQRIGVNVNTIENLDLETLIIRPFDGKSRGKPYTLDP